MLDLTRLRILDAVARTGSVTAAARELRYSQPSLSHHLARLEQETGAQLLQRVGRGIRLTPAGQLLADRAAEILGRVDAAAAELSAHVGLSTGRVRLAGYTSVLSTLVPAAAEILRREHPGLQLTLTDTHPPEALELLRAGHVDVALIFRYDESPPEDADIRLVHLLDDPTYLLTTGEAAPLAEYRDSTWVAGCERCRAHLIDACERAGFTPRIAYTTDDMVLMQALVAAGLGVTMIPGLALRSHQAPQITATEIPSSTRRVYAATYGAPPDPPATAALIAALHNRDSSVQRPPR
jgi:DNA-binding transcriptional LysR family regulator